MGYIHGKSVIQIAIADDHLLVMQALSLLINTSIEKCTVMLQAASGEELIERIDPQNLPDLIIMDISLPGINGLDTMQILKKKHPLLKFLGISMYPPDFMSIRILQHGGHGFIQKNADKDLLKHAIYGIMKSGYYFSDQGFSRVASHILENTSHPLYNLLTDEQILFLRLEATAAPYKTIAGMMKVSPRHIEHLRRTLFERLGVQSRTELTVKAIQMGFDV